MGPEKVQRESCRKILATLKNRGPLSLSEICDITLIPESDVDSFLRNLAKDGFIYYLEERASYIKGLGYFV